MYVPIKKEGPSLLFDDKLKCSNCIKEIAKDENIFILAKANELKGYTYLKGRGEKLINFFEKYFNTHF
ncbi:hypothetical protein Sta0113_03170 [Staphylococcus hominis subsp. hominis]|uniref:hypothetical protein n=1 Tax=Staphylococcus hominis TaxID=1290 RepID=UPI0011A875A6|nr:hypothetical protein [Staphylococcus hominis]UQA65689.1 hypothetical protein Sta0113_03170 [Staphylococcus hominis subsp. hominis]